MTRRLLMLIGFIGVVITGLVIIPSLLISPDNDELTNSNINDRMSSPTSTPNLIASLPIQPLQLQNNTRDAIPLNADQLNLYAVLWSDDGMRLFAIGEQAILAFDASELNITGGWLVGRLSAVYADLSNNGELLGVITRENYLRIWNTQNGTELGQVLIDDTLNALQFLPDGQILLGDDNQWQRAYQLTDRGLEPTELPDSLPDIMPAPDLTEAVTAQQSTGKNVVMIVSANEIAMLDDSGNITHQTTVTEIPAQQTIRLAPSQNNTGCSILVEEACTR